ncbi:MAG: hypothetical protein ABI779_20735 [Acidobacteriota bacterium]
MRNTLSISFVVLLALAGGCNQKNNAASPSTPGAQVATNTPGTADTAVTPERLGELGAKIRKTPDKAQDLLTEYGLTEKTFEAEIRKITEDPEASKRYAAAYKKASA